MDVVNIEIVGLNINWELEFSSNYNQGSELESPVGNNLPTFLKLQVKDDITSNTNNLEKI